MHNKPTLHTASLFLVLFSRLSCKIAILPCILLHIIAWTTQAQELTEKNKCILELYNNGPATMTIGEARAECGFSSPDSLETPENTASDDTGLIQERLESDEKNILKPFSLMAHESNYLIVGAYNFHGWSTSVYEESSSKDISFDDTEIQFQLSIKTPIAIDIFGKDIGIFGAYTMRSFWQAYNSDISSPFRETNHQPEIWIQSEHDWELFGIRNSVNVLGMVHQSNGQSAGLSRSWNRIFAGFLFEKSRFALYLKPWLRIAEPEDDDDNPDITDYLGHGEMHLLYKRNNHVFSLMSRNNLESGFSKGAIELGWSFPLFNYDYIKGYIQYFSGYGESLIDYDNYVNRLGIGILLTDLM